MFIKDVIIQIICFKSLFQEIVSLIFPLKSEIGHASIMKIAALLDLYKSEKIPIKINSNHITSPKCY